MHFNFLKARPLVKYSMSINNKMLEVLYQAALAIAALSFCSQLSHSIRPFVRKKKVAKKKIADVEVFMASNIL
jgi:hypothetical protein